MEYNTWTHKSSRYSVSDQPALEGMECGEVVYRGVKAREVWYKGKRIWNGNATFWKWARPSLLGGSAFSSVENYRLYKQGQTEKRVFGFDSAGHSDAGFLHEDHMEFFDFSGSSAYDPVLYPPPVRIGQYYETLTGIQKASYSGEGYSSFKFSVTGAKRDRELLATLDTGWSSRARIYQSDYPFAMLETNHILIPPGTYSYPGTAAPIGMSRYAATAGGGDQNYRFIKIVTDDESYEFIQRYLSYMATSYDFYHDDSLKYASGWTGAYSFTVNKPQTVKITTEVGASNSGTFSWGPRLTRTEKYYTGVRAGQLRGYLNTKPDFTGERFLYVVDDKRLKWRGTEYNLDPTMCLDPDTLEYVRCTGTVNRDAVVGIIPGYYLDAVDTNDSYKVTFYENYVEIIKYRDGKYVDRATLRLYYEQGFPFYGEAEE